MHHGGLERGAASMADTEPYRIPGQRSRDIDRFTSETCGLTQKIRMLKSAPMAARPLQPPGTRRWPNPLAACNTDSSSPSLSLVVQADRDFAPGLRGRAIRAASMKRPGACALAAASRHRAEQATHRAGQAPPRTGPSLTPRTQPGPTRRSTSDPAPSALEAGAMTR